MKCFFTSSLNVQYVYIIIKCRWKIILNHYVLDFLLVNLHDMIRWVKEIINHRGKNSQKMYTYLYKMYRTIKYEKTMNQLYTNIK